MNKLLSTEQKKMDNEEPWAQLMRLGSRLKEVSEFGVSEFAIFIPAGTTGKIVPIAPGQQQVQSSAGVVNDGVTDADLLFDFEVVDVTVRTETTVASSTLQAKQGSNAITDAIASNTANALTRAGTVNPAYNKFYPRSQGIAAYNASPLNLVDASGATAPARTVYVKVRRI